MKKERRERREKRENIYQLSRSFCNEYNQEILSGSCYHRALPFHHRPCNKYTRFQCFTNQTLRSSKQAEMLLIFIWSYKTRKQPSNPRKMMGDISYPNFILYYETIIKTVELG